MVAEQLLCPPAPTSIHPDETQRAMAWESIERGGAREVGLGGLGQEEEINQSPVRASGGRSGQGETSPATISSTSDNGSAPTLRGVNCIKPRLIRMSENLRTSVADNNAECERALEQ